MRANSKSRWSWAGTAITAPVPYSASTKLATQMGTGHPVNGLMQRRPVSKPSFSMAPVRRSVRSRARNSCTCFRSPAGSGASSTKRDTSGCSGASRTNVAPKMVSMRVVKTSISAAAPPPAGASAPAGSTANRTRAPSERSIQFRCIVSTSRATRRAARMPSSRPSACS